MTTRGERLATRARSAAAEAGKLSILAATRLEALAKRAGGGLATAEWLADQTTRVNEVEGLLARLQRSITS